MVVAAWINYSINIQSTFNQHSINIQSTFNQHSINIQSTFNQLCHRCFVIDVPHNSRIDVYPLQLQLQVQTLTTTRPIEAGHTSYSSGMVEHRLVNRVARGRKVGSRRVRAGTQHVLVLVPVLATRRRVYACLFTHFLICLDRRSRALIYLRRYSHSTA
jgi:hypothetical protein